ncbi:hypothetical protein OG455_06715 [Kitasatospora sp. NBC_01287]|uniref:hypothetical protein n=1 Tax=Kitasatospora sp. NBC_01287 TaxID=2903573 RepID=UPI00224DE82D|nr:hypothetical protein [Kitasatospora sp. NBC_01287]MCX4745215.1 hypothetical protein [Kitasatospora sp. NBC_01287]
MRLFRTLSALAVAGTLALSTAPATAGAAAPSAATAPAASAEHRAPGIYISPWGSAHVRVSAETAAWLSTNGVKLGAIAPFVIDPDGLGFDMPIGSTAGDHIDAQGRIFYPGGMTLDQASTGTHVELEPTWIRLVPQPGYSAGITVNGQKISDETLIAYTTPAEVLANGRPTLTGFMLDRVPFHVTPEAAALTAQWFGDGLKADSMFGTLTPRFDYVPA